MNEIEITLDDTVENQDWIKWRTDDSMDAIFATTLQAAFNPDLHPRDRSGRWIEVGDLITFLLGEDKHTGTVTGVHGDQIEVDGSGPGSLLVSPSSVLSVKKKKAALPFAGASSVAAALEPVDVMARAEQMLGHVPDRRGSEEDAAAIEKAGADIKRETLRALAGATGDTSFGKTLESWMTGNGVIPLQRSVASIVHAPESTEPFPFGQTREDVATALLDELRTSAPTPELYRGVNLKGVSLEDALARYPVGSTFDLNLSSFSPNELVARMFGVKGFNGTPVIIKAKPGGHGLPIQNLAGGGGDQSFFWRSQEEYIAGGRYKVTGVYVTNKDGVDAFGGVITEDPDPHWHHDDVVVVEVEEVAPL